MNPWITDAGNVVGAAAVMGLDVALKAAVVGAVAAIAHRALGDRRVLVRSALWNACLIGLIVLPVSAASPRLRVAWLPARAEPAPLLQEHSAVPPAQDAGTRIARAVPVPRVADHTFIAVPNLETAEPWDRRTIVCAAVVGVYAAGVLVLLIRLASALVAVRRLCRAAAMVEARGWLDTLDRWRARLGIRSSVRLAQSERLSVPVALECVQPTIILPSGYATTDDVSLRDAVVLHELAHLRRRDYAWNIVLRLVQAMYWPHPVAWFLGRTVSAVREQACDELCVFWMEDVMRYRTVLLGIAATLVRRPENVLGLAMARTSKLGRRLRTIEGSRGISTCLLGWRGRALIAVVVVSTFLAAGSVRIVRTVDAQESGVHAPTPPTAEPSPEASRNAKSSENAPRPRAAGAGDEPPPAQENEPDEGTREIPVVVARVKRGDVPVMISLLAELEASDDVDVFPRISGFVKSEKLAAVGTRVKKGDVLAEIDSPDLGREIVKAKASLVQARARREQARATVAATVAAATVAEARLKDAKEKGVVQTSHTAGLDQARAEREAALAGLTAADSALETAQADPLIQTSLEVQTRLVAPMDGVITKRTAVSGRPVRPGEGPPLFRISNRDQLRARTEISDGYIDLANVGDPVELLVRTKRISTAIAHIGLDLDPKTHTLPIEMDIPNSDGSIRLGTQATAVITLEVLKNVLVIPRHAFYSPQTYTVRPSCFRVVDGRAVATPLKIATRFPLSSGRLAEVEEGLHEGDLVIINISVPGGRTRMGINVAPLAGWPAQRLHGNESVKVAKIQEFDEFSKVVEFPGPR